MRGRGGGGGARGGRRLGWGVGGEGSRNAGQGGGVRKAWGWGDRGGAGGGFKMKDLLVGTGVGKGGEMQHVRKRASGDTLAQEFNKVLTHLRNCDITPRFPL